MSALYDIERKKISLFKGYLFNDAVKNAEQRLILDEFIKYKILADQLFSYTQATNYDTTKFSSSDLYLKKELGWFDYY